MVWSVEYILVRFVNFIDKISNSCGKKTFEMYKQTLHNGGERVYL
jgi:hypothetical protein